MSSWVALHRVPEAEELLKRHPNAFLLYSLMAIRSRWQDCNVSGLKKGECFVGDYKSAGLTERSYRTAKSTLERCGFATFKPTNKGTVATLLPQGIFSIETDEATDKTTGNRRTNDEQATTNIHRYTDTQIPNGVEQGTLALPHVETKPKKKTRKEQKEPSKEALEIYEAYPKKAGRAKALEAIESALKKIPFSELLGKVNQYAQSRIGENPQYTKDPKNWFNEERWEDFASQQQQPTKAKYL